MRALESVFTQTLAATAYEVIVVDDQSTDDSLAIANQYADKIRSFQTPSFGAVKALNFGLSQVKTPYFTILDADDSLPKTALASLLDGFRINEEAAFVYGNYTEYDTTSKIIDTSQNIFDTIAGGILFKIELVIQEGKYDESLFFPEYDLLIKLIEKYPIVHQNDLVYSYFRHASSMTANKEKVDAGIKQITERYGRSFPIRKY